MVVGRLKEEEEVVAAEKEVEMVVPPRRWFVGETASSSCLVSLAARA